MTSGRLVLREARTGRLLGTAKYRGATEVATPVLFRPRLSRARWRRLQRGARLAVTVQDTRHVAADGVRLADSPLARMTLVG